MPPLARDFRDARHACSLTVPACATLLRVSERTIRNWETGSTRIPYTAFKLMRVLRGGKLLGPAWRDFYVHGATLYTPEGHRFEAGDLAWWSLLVRRARAFSDLLRDLAAIRGRPQPGAASSGAGKAAPGCARPGQQDDDRPAAPASETAPEGCSSGLVYSSTKGTRGRAISPKASPQLVEAGTAPGPRARLRRPRDPAGGSSKHPQRAGGAA